VAKEHWENSVKQRAWKQLTSLAARNSLHVDIALAFDILIAITQLHFSI